MCKNVRRVREAAPPSDLVENSTFFAGFEVFVWRGSLKNPKKLISTEVLITCGSLKVKLFALGRKVVESRMAHDQP